MIRWILISTIITIHVSSAQDIVFDPSLKITNESLINTEVAEFSPGFWGEDLIYVKASSKESSQTGYPHFDLYVAARNLDNQLINSAILSPVLNTPFHEGPAYYDETSKTLYYSSIDLKDSLGDSNLPPNKILNSSFLNGEWQKPNISELNMAKTSSLHPTLSKDGIWMVFASNREEGLGNMDLYMSVKKDTIWGTAVNLGNLINTSKAEVFPYIDEQLNLYFSRKNEDTGLDIYLSVFQNGHYLKPVKLPKPLNSEYDDFGLCINSTEGFGYFSSNRPNGKGDDDIYKFEFENKLFYTEASENEIQLTIRHKDLKTPLANAQVNIRKLDDLELSGIDPNLYKLNPIEIYDSLRTNKEGIVIINNPLESFLIEVIYPGMKPWNKIYIQNASRREIEIFLTEENLEKKPILKETPIEITNKDLKVGSVITFNHIYYAYNSYSIEEGAAYELDALAEYLKENESVKIELIAHTDSRGDSVYNQSLSEKRAKAAKSYLQLKGIEGYRIRTSGKGESKILNHCVDGVECSDEEHNFNRRTEVIILSK